MQRVAASRVTDALLLVIIGVPVGVGLGSSSYVVTLVLMGIVAAIATFDTA